MVMVLTMLTVNVIVKDTYLTVLVSVEVNMKSLNAVIVYIQKNMIL